MTYVTYITAYRGMLLPTFYIGSSSAQRVRSGYHGSVRSIKWRATWEAELVANPHLFETVIIGEYKTRDESLNAEVELQKLFNAVKDPNFINMAYARAGFFNPGTEGYTPEVRARMSDRAKKRDRTTPSEIEARKKISLANTGKKRTPEQKERMRQASYTRKKAPPVSDETREKLRQANLRVWALRKGELSSHS